MDISSIRYAHRFDQVTGSAIREIFKVIAQPGMISFAGGNPSLDALPDRQVDELAHYVLEKDGKAETAAEKKGLNEEAGVPLLAVEVDQQMGSYEQARSAVEAFAEMLRG